MNLKLKPWPRFLLISYLVLSGVFILQSLWKQVTEGYYENAFMKGREYTVAEILGKALDGSCEPFTVYNQTNTVELINTSCNAPAEVTPKP